MRPSSSFVVGFLAAVAPSVAAAHPDPWTDAAAAVPDSRDDAVTTTDTGPLDWDDTFKYGDERVREAGASVGFMFAPNFRTFTLMPSFGWFIADHVQLSALAGVTHIQAEGDDTTIATAMFEPSYHLRLDRKTLAFAGMGFGYSYVTGVGHGLTFTIRTGAQFQFGKRYLFIPSISYDFRTNKDDSMDIAERAAESALRINLGAATHF